MSTKRFSKAAALEALDKRATRIAEDQRFGRSNGTSQLLPPGATEADRMLIDRAVEYGRMRAFEQFACAIEEGFRFEG